MLRYSGQVWGGEDSVILFCTLLAAYVCGFPNYVVDCYDERSYRDRWNSYVTKYGGVPIVGLSDCLIV